MAKKPAPFKAVLDGIKKVRSPIKKGSRSQADYSSNSKIKATKKLEVSYNRNTKSLLFMGWVQGETDKYLVVARFNGMDFQESKPTDGEWIMVSKVDSGKSPVWVRKPSLSSDDVRVRCGSDGTHAKAGEHGCEDFRFNFEYQLAQSGNLAGGRWQRYKRKTSPSNRADKVPVKGMKMIPWNAMHELGSNNIRKATADDEKTTKDGKWAIEGRSFKNPTNELGICKHVWKFMEALVMAKMIMR